MRDIALWLLGSTEAPPSVDIVPPVPDDISLVSETQHAGDEGCLDLIIETADSVEDLDLTGLQAAASRPAVVTARIAETDPVNEAGTGVTEPAVDQSVALSIAPAAGSPADLVDHLERLAHLYAVGALTVDEFSTAKARLLGLQATDSP